MAKKSTTNRIAENGDETIRETAQSEERLLKALEVKQMKKQQEFIEGYNELAERTGWRLMAQVVIRGGELPHAELVPVQAK